MAFMVLSSIFVFLLGGSSAATITITSHCNYTIWPVIAWNPGSPGFPNMFTCIKLSTNKSKRFSIPHGPGWSGWIWARTHCTNFSNLSGTFACATGDCRRPSPLSSSILDHPANQTATSTKLAIDINVAPRNGLGCSNAVCAIDINVLCPPELRVVERAGGPAIACMSGCQALGDDADCCLGRYWGPNKCRPTKFVMMFESLCPLAMSFFVYETAFRYCRGSWDYLVTFCPKY